MAKGGYRPGSGNKKGNKSQKVLERDEALRQFRSRVQLNTQRLMDAQFGIALGSQYLFKRPKGSPEAVLVTDVDEIRDYLNGQFDGSQDAYYFMTTKDPDNRALDSLFNRTYGKAVDSIDLTAGGEPIKTIKVVIETDGEDD